MSLGPGLCGIGRIKGLSYRPGAGNGKRTCDAVPLPLRKRVGGRTTLPAPATSSEKDQRQTQAGGANTSAKSSHFIDLRGLRVSER